MRPRWRLQLARLDAVADSIELPLLLAIVAMIPLEFTKLWFPVTWIDVSRIGIVIALGLLLVHLMAGTIRLKRSILLVAVGVVTLVEIGSFLLTRWPLGTKEAVAVGVYAAFAVYVGHVLSSRARLSSLALTLVASTLMVALIALAQEAWNFDLWPEHGIDTLGRRSSTFGDPNIAARFLAIGLIVCLAVLAVRPAINRFSIIGMQRRTIGGLALITAIAAVVGVADVLTLSRTGWLIALLAIAMWVPFALRRRQISVGIFAFSVAFAGYLILTPSASHRASSVTVDALTRIGVVDPGDGVLPPDLTMPEDPTAVTPFDDAIEHIPLDSVRRYLIRAGLAMTLDHPLVGVGIGGFDGQLRKSYWKYVPIDRRGSPTTLLHTDVIRVVAETGMIGLAAWLCLLGAVVVTARRGLRGTDLAKRTAFWATSTSIVVILIASQLAGRFYTEPYFWLALGILLGLSAGAAADDRAGEAITRPETGLGSPG